MRKLDNKYLEFVKEKNEELNISIGQLIDFGLEIHPEEKNLELLCMNNYGKPILLEQNTLSQFLRMRRNCEKDGIYLNVLSGYRDVSFQFSLWKSKLNSGYKLKEIFAVLMPPGFSEHHTGTALDISNNKGRLTTDFEKTDEFQWLVDNSLKFGFNLTYNRNNNFGVNFEPWHWRYHGIG